MIFLVIISFFPGFFLFSLIHELLPELGKLECLCEMSAILS